MSLDFLDLYKELGLGRGAGLEEMKRAYRRRVSELHPDRNLSLGDTDTRLQQLTALYARAMQFHRHHGRLPGAPTLHPATHAPEKRPPQQPAPAPAARPRRFRLRWLILATLVVLGWILLAQQGSDVDPNASPAAIAPGTLAPTRAPAAEDVDDAATVLRRSRMLTLGMTVEDVAEIEGEPITRSDSRWDYGASWIAFEQGKVSDWYSSPLQPLKHATKHAPPPEPRRDDRRPSS